MQFSCRRLALVVTLLSACACFSQVKQEEVSFPSGKLMLHGFLYKPEGTGPFPAVVWNHGSERMPGWLPELGTLFAGKGYIFFIPHRRGQGRSPGDYIMTLLVQEQQRNGEVARNRKLVELMDEHLEDQVAAIGYLKGVAGVDSSKIAVAGCSFGGIQSVLAAEKPLGIRAAIDFAGAAQNWGRAPRLRQRMSGAVEHAQVPVFFIQAKNDYDLTPSRELDAVMEKAGRPHQLKIFPPFGETNQEGHEFCVKGSKFWGDDVFTFLQSAMKGK